MLQILVMLALNRRWHEARQPSSESTSVVDRYNLSVKQIVPAHVRRQKIKFNFMYQNTQNVYDDEKSKGERRSYCIGPSCSQSYLGKKCSQQNRWCVSTCSLTVELILVQAVKNREELTKYRLYRIDDYI